MSFYKGERNRNAVLKISTTSLVKLLILNFLSKKDYYGNQLIETISKTFKDKWEPSPGMIYPLLRDLEEKGYIKGWWREPDKKTIRYYKITDQGLEYFKIIKKSYKSTLDDSLEMVNNILQEVYK
ncbi:PadR family transcriptional regulator [Irregularibacter muris]|uniref:PadR family transcriptional regulator n=1 Tax=Irregularibacter muris TaxID=1796619 RepID=A0AAE3HFH3_9FIRM|nr:PadR family transcriptional regulator [Irregularibacter muris]MCR1898084.1 PadR family transcriptional regulator [Irregularibacter muris]